MERQREFARKLYEEYAYTLDFLPHGRFGFRAEPTAQLLGETYFTLLEAVVRPNVTLTRHERVYVGKDKREKIDHIKNRLSYDELTSTAKSELPIVIEEVVKAQEVRFVHFLNTASAITPRMHAIKLIPNIGKKHVREILRQREIKPFESFEDVQKRADIHNLAKLIGKRIFKELTTATKYRIFTRAP